MCEADLLSAGAFVVAQMRALAVASSPLPPGFAAPPTQEADFIVKLDARVQLASLRTMLPAPVPRGGGASGATTRKVSARGSGSKSARTLAQAAVPLLPRAAPFPHLPELDVVPQAAAWEVLMLWDLGNTFGPLLQLPPFSVDRAAAAFWECGAPGLASGEAAASSPPADARVAAATLFSDFCRGLYRVVSGERNTPWTADASFTVAQPSAHPENVTASALDTSLGRVAWPARVADLFDRADASEDETPAGAAFSGVATAALSAALEADVDVWAALAPSQRLALATSLADAASASESFREYFNAVHEAAHAAQRLGRVPSNPVRQPVADRGELPAPVDGLVAPLADPATPAAPARSWEEAAADRSLLRRGLPVGIDELGNRYYELGGAAGANLLFVASPTAEEPGTSAALDFGSPPRLSLVGSGSRAASELASWLLPRRCAGEHAPKAFCERLAAALETSGAQPGPSFLPPAPVADGYSNLEPAASLPGGLLGVRRAVAALARRVYFWQLPADELARFVLDLRKFDEAESSAEGAAPADDYSLDIVAAHAVSVCTRLTASRALPASVWDSAARHVWQDLLAEAVTAPQLGAALVSLHAALEAAESATAPGGAPVVMDRPSFLRAALQHDRTLWVPAVGDDVAVLRTGLLRSWRCLSKSWDVAPPTGLAPVTRARVVAASYRRASSGASYGRRAVAWLLLDAVDGVAPFVAPVLLAEGAPECVLAFKLVADARASPWSRGDAVRILVVDDDSSERRVPGVVVKTRENGGDPWESVRIRCPPDTAGESHRSAWVSPWELSSDDDAGVGGGALLELPTSDEDEDEEAEASLSSSSSLKAEQAARGPDAGAVTGRRKLHGRRHRSSGGKAGLLRAPAAARPVPVPLGASADSVTAATRQLLADIQRGDPAAPPAAGDAAAACLAGMKEFGRRYRAYWQSRGGTPRVPIFARMELELWPAFQAVASRGGYDAVGASKQWIAVARSLPGRDLSTATSASFSMRVAYERSVFAFERSTVALLLGHPDPFPASLGVAATVAEVCGHDERNRRKSGGSGAAARKPAVQARRPKRAHSEPEDGSSSDDDDAAAAAVMQRPPVQRPPPRASRGGATKPAVAAVEENWDLAGVAAGRRARKRVCYKDSDSQEEDEPAVVRKPAAKAAPSRRRAPRSSDEDEDEDEDEEMSDGGSSDADSDADSDAESDEAEEDAVSEEDQSDEPKGEERKSASDKSDSEEAVVFRHPSRHKAHRRVIDDDDEDE